MIESNERAYKQMTDMQLLRLLVPDIDERLEKKTDLTKEILERATKRECGYRPLHWMQGCD